MDARSCARHSEVNKIREMNTAPKNDFLATGFLINSLQKLKVCTVPQCGNAGTISTKINKNVS